jgi:hypothetical protein
MRLKGVACETDPPPAPDLPHRVPVPIECIVGGAEYYVMRMRSRGV